MSLLEARGLRGGYGEVDILHGIDLAVEADEIAVIVGPNGAGKSTAMKALFGLIHVREGTVAFDGADITNRRPDRIVGLGLGYVPQEHNVFPSLTVRENLEMGAYLRRDDFAPQMERIFEIFSPLADKRRRPAGQLSGGERQMVAIGRVLMLEPRLLLLDEPTAGLSPRYTDLIFERIVAINALGVAVLMVEQNARAALGFAHRGYVLAMGRNRFTDSGANLLANREVAEMFLGG